MMANRDHVQARNIMMLAIRSVVSSRSAALSAKDGLKKNSQRKQRYTMDFSRCFMRYNKLIISLPLFFFLLLFFFLYHF